MKKNNIDLKIGSEDWNDDLFLKHPTPYKGVAGKVEYQRAKEILSIIKNKNFHKDSNILEIGCEQGNLIEFLKNKIPHNTFFGTDISTIALKEAKKKLGDKVVLFQNDITKSADIDIPKIDVLICSEVLEHIPNYISAISNLSKLVDKNTLVIITVPLEKYKNNIKIVLKKIGLFDLLFKGIEEGLSEWHVNDFSKADITKALEKNFDIKSYKLMMFLHQILVLKKK